MIDALMEMNRCFEFGERLGLPCITAIQAENGTWRVCCDSIYPRFPVLHTYQYEATGTTNDEAYRNLAQILEAACATAGV